jgi:hypothetical protein
LAAQRTDDLLDAKGAFATFKDFAEPDSLCASGKRA